MKVTAHELRAAAEHADGLRGQPGLRLAYRDKPRGLDDRRRGVIVVEELEGNDIDLQVDAETPYNHGATMTPPHRVTVQYEQTSAAQNVQTSLDALFWSQSAVEKFLLPYYVRVLPEHEFNILRRAMEDPRVHALGHRPPTVYVPDPESTDEDADAAFTPIAADIGMLFESEGQLRRISLPVYARLAN